MSSVSDTEAADILGRMTDAFFALDTDRRFTYLNESGRQIICAAIGAEYSVEELQGRHIWEEIPDAVGTTFYQEYERAFETGETASFEEYYQPLDTWFEVNAYPSESGLSVYFQDVTERVQTTQELEETVEVLTDLYRVPSDSDASFRQRVNRILDLGRRRLDLPYAVLTRLTEQTQTVVASRGDHLILSEGETYPRDEGYFGRIIEADDPVVAFDTTDDDRRSSGNPFSLDSYIGGKLLVDGELYGTICFASEQSKFDGFTKSERTFVKLAAQWLGYELEQREYRREIERKETQYRTLAQNKPNGAVFLFDQDHRYVVADGQELERVGLSSEEMVGSTLEEVFSEDVVQIQKPKYEAILDGEEVHWEQSYDGQHYSINGVPLPDEDGEVRRGMLVTNNVTERVQRERRLRTMHDVATELVSCVSSEDVYETLLEGLEEVLDVDLTIIDVLEDNVLVPESASGRADDLDYYDAIPVTDEDSVAAEVFRTRNSSVVDDLQEIEAEPADGRYRSALTAPIGNYGIVQVISSEPRSFEDDDLALVETLASHARTTLERIERERSLRNRTDELARQNERLDDFVNIVSHDLRSPLTVARGRVNLAQEECDSSHLDDVEEAHERMEQLIDDLLQSAREGITASDVERVSLARAAETCWENVATEAATLEVESDASIRADSSRLQQLLANLYRNAVEHAGEDVTVVVGSLDEADGFHVTDDGPGIPPESRDKLFEFGYSEGEGGTGFGLAIVDQIADAHDWSVTVTEGPDGGARFEFTGVETLSS